MKFVNKTQKFQDGGQMMPVEAAPMPAEAPQQGGDPMQMLVEAAMSAVQNQDPNMAMEVCMMLLELVGATPGQAPVGAPQSQPVFAKGGKLKRKNSKKC
mgnify:CR=1 FL=1